MFHWRNVNLSLTAVFGRLNYFDEQKFLASDLIPCTDFPSSEPSLFHCIQIIVTIIQCNELVIDKYDTELC